MQAEMRFFLPGLRIFHGLMRPGISIDPEDMRSSLPPRRRHEYREALKAWVTWFKYEREGIYYGQCSQIFGKDHADMPIAIRFVSEENYAAWLAEASKKFALKDTAPVHFAANDAAGAKQ